MRNPSLYKKILVFFAFTFMYFFAWLYILSNGTCTISFDEIGNLSNLKKSLFIMIYIIIIFIYILFQKQIKSLFEKNDYKKLDMQYVSNRNKNEKYLFFRSSLIGDIKEVYFISNKKGDIFYKIYLDKVFPKEYIVEDYKKNVVAKIKSNILETFIVNNIIEINNKQINFTRKHNGVIEIDGISNLTIDSNNQYSEKNTIKLDKNTIANVDVFSMNNEYNVGDYDIIINNSKFELEVICFVLCILISSSTYRKLKD